MHAIGSQSAAIGSIPKALKNDYIHTRTTKIALAIFASLTAFVFLPFGVALVLSAVVTLGAIECSNETKQPPKADETEFSIEHESNYPDRVIVTLDSEEKRDAFAKKAQSTIADLILLPPNKEKPNQAIFQLTDDAKRMGKTPSSMYSALFKIRHSYTAHG